MIRLTKDEEQRIRELTVIALEKRQWDTALLDIIRQTWRESKEASAAQCDRAIILIEDAEGEHECDVYVLGPEAMSGDNAAELCAELVRQVKRAHPENTDDPYTFDDLEPVLTAYGFIKPPIAPCPEDW